MEQTLNFSNVESPHAVTADWVLSKVSQEQIMYAYFGDFVPYKKVYNSVFRRDKNASTGFFYGTSGELVYYDIGTGENLNCFAFVAKMYGVTYFKAVRKVACDFGLISCRDLPFEKKEINNSVVFDKKSKEEILIEVPNSKWTDKHLSYWKGYEISKEELIREGVVPASSVKINGNFIASHNLRFAYRVVAGDRTYYKLYSPYSNNFKWISNIPLHIPFGMGNLSYDSDTIIITKSVKEMIIWKKFFKSVISTQNESEGALNNGMVNHLVKNFKRRIIQFDADEVGVMNCKKFNMKGFDYINTPNNLLSRGIKDVGDFVKEFGLDVFKQFLQYKKLL